MTLSRLKLNLDKFATFNHAKLYVQSVPVIYLPWGILPRQGVRSPGLLPTFPSFSSTFGVSLALPYFQPLGDTMMSPSSPNSTPRRIHCGRGNTAGTPNPPFRHGTLTARAHPPADRRRDPGTDIYKDLWQREDGWQHTANINQTSDSLVEADYAGA